MYKFLIRPLLFQMDPERIHRLGGALLRLMASLAPLRWVWRLVRARRRLPLIVTWRGLTFETPIGLAAGFDKNARLPQAVEMLGFGFMEVGSVTAQAWEGNPVPRLFRLPEDRALINRMGLNNHGADVVTQRLATVRKRISIPILVNVAKTPAPDLEGERAVQDYVETVRKVKGVADAVVLNISCPNSGDGRTFEDPELLTALLRGVVEELESTGPPLLVKLSPDLDDQTLVRVVNLSMAEGACGFVASNTSTNRSTLTTSSSELEAIGAGGMSGRPLMEVSRDRVARVRELIGDDLFLIGVGGVFGPEDAQALLDSGANLVEGYTGFVYEGPNFANRITRGLRG